MCRPKGTRPKDRCEKHAAGPDRSAADRARRHAQAAVASRQETSGYAQAAYGEVNGAPLRRGSMWQGQLPTSPAAQEPAATPADQSLRPGSMWRHQPGAPAVQAPASQATPTPQPESPRPTTDPWQQSTPPTPPAQPQPKPVEAAPQINGRKALRKQVAPGLTVEDLAIRLEHDDYGRRAGMPYSQKVLEELSRAHKVTEVVRPPHWRPPLPGQKPTKDKTVTRPATLAEMPRDARRRFEEAQAADKAYEEYKKRHLTATRADVIEQQLLAQHGVEKLTDLDDSQLGEWMTARAHTLDNRIDIPADHAAVLKAANAYRAERDAKQLRKKVRKTVKPKDRAIDPALLKELGVVNPLYPGESVQQAATRIVKEHRDLPAVRRELDRIWGRMQELKRSLKEQTGWTKSPDQLVHPREHREWKVLEAAFGRTRHRLERHAAEVRAISALTGRPFADIR